MTAKGTGAFKTVFDDEVAWYSCKYVCEHLLQWSSNSPGQNSTCLPVSELWFSSRSPRAEQHRLRWPRERFVERSATGLSSLVIFVPAKPSQKNVKKFKRAPQAGRRFTRLCRSNNWFPSARNSPALRPRSAGYRLLVWSDWIQDGSSVFLYYHKGDVISHHTTFTVIHIYIQCTCVFQGSKIADFATVVHKAGLHWGAQERSLRVKSWGWTFCLNHLLDGSIFLKRLKFVNGLFFQNILKKKKSQMGEIKKKKMWNETTLFKPELLIYETFLNCIHFKVFYQYCT